jgi:L-alanine-DL-glutamate epimerase-like enolase superfamily enzyme
MTMPSPLALDIARIDLPLRKPFRISGYVFEVTPVVVVTARRGGHSGRGEAAGVYYLKDTPDVAAETLRQFARTMPSDLTRESLQDLLPPGGARNALDCALWELEARERGVSPCELAGLPPAHSLLTTVTLGADSPSTMAEGACRYAFARALKLKLSGEVAIDVERVRAVRAARNDVWLGVDANQGYTPATLEQIMPTLLACDVQLLEQPFRRGRESDLDGLRLPLPVAADESCLHLGELRSLVGRFDVVNIKLDKCGGLTEGLEMARRAQDLGLKVMVGNMTGTSLSVGPAYVLGQLCDIVDLDGPLFLADDPAPRVTYADGLVDCPPAVWGGPAG